MAQDPQPPLNDPLEAPPGSPKRQQPVVNPAPDGGDDEASDGNQDTSEASGDASALIEPDDPTSQVALKDRVSQLYNFGLSHDRSRIHDMRWHDLYEDIAGIERRQDWPGLGKTYTAIEAMVRVMMIVSLGVDIRNERDNLAQMLAAPDHIHEEHHRIWGKNSQCRADTLRRYGVVCPCDPDSPTAALIKPVRPDPQKDKEYPPFSEGYMLVIVPADLVTQWVQEIRAFIRDDALVPHSQMPIAIVDTSAVENQEGRALRDFLWRRPGGGSSEPLGFGSICIAATTVLSQSIRTYNASLRSGSYDLLQQSCMIICDEAHNIKNSATQWPTLMRHLVEDAMEPVHVLAISGSPIGSQGPNLTAIEDIAKTENFGIWFGKQTRAQYIKELDRTRKIVLDRARDMRTSDAIRKCTRSNDISEDERQEALDLIRKYDQSGRDYFNALPVLQRRALDDYLGHQIPRLAPNSKEPEVIHFYSTMNEHQKALGRDFLKWLKSGLPHRVSEWEREAQANVVFRGTTLSTQRQAVRTSWWRDNWGLNAFGWDEATQTSSSNKANYICSVIDRMLDDKELHRGRDPALGPLRKKAIICVPYPWHAYILMAFLFAVYPEYNFTYIGSCFQSKREKAALREPFSRQTIEDDDRERDPDDPIALISTYRYIAEGHNLQRCNYVIATSPMAHVNFELQLFARATRRNQNCSTHFYMLMDHGDPTDVVFYHRRRLHTPDTVPPNERCSGYRFLRGEEIEGGGDGGGDGGGEVEHGEPMDVDPPGPEVIDLTSDSPPRSS